MKDLTRIADVMRLVSADCEADASKLDSTPFTPRGIGETLGTMLAQIKACADATAAIAEQLSEQTSGPEPDGYRMGDGGNILPTSQ